MHPSPKLSLAEVQRRAVGWLSPAAPWMVLVWLVGVLALSLWNLGAWVAVQQLKSSTSTPAPHKIADMAARLAKRLGLCRSLRLLQSAVIDSPLVTGMLHPALLLP